MKVKRGLCSPLSLPLEQPWLPQRSLGFRFPLTLPEKRSQQWRETTRKGEKSKKSWFTWIQLSLAGCLNLAKTARLSRMDIKLLWGQRSARRRAALYASHLLMSSSSIRGVTWGLHPAKRQSGLTTGLHLWPCRPLLPPFCGQTDVCGPPELLPDTKACSPFVLNLTLNIPSSSSSSLDSTFPSFSAFFHSLGCQELNDTAELAHCYGNRFVIGRVDWGRVWNVCGWGHGVLGGWVRGLQGLVVGMVSRLLSILLLSLYSLSLLVVWRHSHPLAFFSGPFVEGRSREVSP